MLGNIRSQIWRLTLDHERQTQPSVAPVERPALHDDASQRPQVYRWSRGFLHQNLSVASHSGIHVGHIPEQTTTMAIGTTSLRSLSEALIQDQDGTHKEVSAGLRP